MVLLSGIWLLGVWGLWLAATAGGMENLAGWTFVLVYAGLALGLLMGVQRLEQGIIQLVLRLVAAGFALLAVGELGWLTFFKDGAAGGNVILPNIPYYASDIVFAYAAIRFFASAEQLFGISRGWLYGSAAVAAIIMVATSWGGYKPELGFWTDSLDNLINAFASLLFLALGYLTRGGIWSRWAIPASLGFGLRLIGNIYYTLTADTYGYGSPADWFWLLGTSVLYVYLFQRELQAARLAENGN